MTAQFPLGPSVLLSSAAQVLSGRGQPIARKLSANSALSGCAYRRQTAVAVFVLVTSVLFSASVAKATTAELQSGTEQATAGASRAGQANTDVQELELGQPIEHEIAGGQHHSYQVTLGSGQFLHAVVEPHGIAVTTTLTGPNGTAVMQLAIRAGSSQPVFIVAKDQGTYHIEIRPPEGAAAGSYRVNVEELRVASKQDTDRALAQSALVDGQQLHKDGTTASKQKAIQKYEQALSLWRATGDRGEEGRTLHGIAEVYASLAQWQKALEYFNQALPLEREMGDRAGEAKTLVYIGVMYHRLGESEKALDYYKQGLPLMRALGDQAGEGETLTDIGWVYDLLGDKQNALNYYKQALPLARAGGDKAVEARVLNNTGIVYSDLGEKQKALDYYHQALQLACAVKNRSAEAQTLNNLGTIYYELDERQKALDIYHQALLLTRAAGNRAREAEILNNIGLVYDDLGDRQEALDYCHQALALARVGQDRYQEGEALHDIAWIYYELGETQKAVEYFNQSLLLQRVVENRHGQGWTLGDLGTTYHSLGEEQKALDYYNQALSLLREEEDRTGEGRMLDGIGQVYAVLGEKPKALEYYTQALRLRGAVGDRAGEAATHKNIALLEREEGSLVEALAQIEAATKIIESVRTEVLSEELRASYFATVQNNYVLYIDVLMRLHRLHPGDRNEAKALEVSEQARARSLLETLAEAQANIRQGVDSALLERERSLRQLLKGKEEVQIKLLNGKHTEEQADGIKKEIAQILSQYEEVEAQIRATSPRYAALTQPQPLSVPQIQQQLAANTLLLEYSLGDGHSYLWAVGPDSLRSFQLPKRSEVDAAARRFYDLLTARNRQVKGETAAQKQARLQQAEAQYPQAAAALSRMLLGPTSPLIKGKRLVIVADGALQYVPFAALPEPTRFKSANTRNAAATVNHASLVPLVVGHEIVNLPSASTLAVLRQEIKGRQPAANMVAVLADPVFDSHDPRVGKTVRSSESAGQHPPQKTGRTRAREDSATASATETPSSTAATPEPEMVSLSVSLAEGRLTRSASDVGVSQGGELHFPRLAFSRREALDIVAAAPAGQGMMAVDFQASLQTATDPELAHYRIVHFATHGLLNSEHPELSGLVLSLVDEQGRPQDGFLQLQDIYNLNLPADLVVLSACETGLGKEIRGEGLMGLTRGFMYAGASRVIASLWKVDDVATAELMKRMYRGMLVQGLPPSAALRESQIEMWKQPTWESPYYWAAFVMQGEWN